MTTFCDIRGISQRLEATVQYNQYGTAVSVGTTTFCDLLRYRTEEGDERGYCTKRMWPLSSSHTGRRINEEEKTRGKHFSNITPPPSWCLTKNRKLFMMQKYFFLTSKTHSTSDKSQTPPTFSTYNYLDYYVLLLPPSTLHHILRCFYS